jgi:polysaccharide biosynthesis protein PelC
MIRFMAWNIVLLLNLGCAVSQVHRGQAVDLKTHWVQLPMMNYCENPHAGERAESIVGTLLRARGVVDLSHYPAPRGDNGPPDFDEQRRFEDSLAWARTKGFVYGLTGSVEEWTYRTGLDGDAAVGLTLQVIELESGRVVWSASGSRSGWGRETLSGVAHKLMDSLLAELRP